MPLNRRTFINTSAATVAATSLLPSVTTADDKQAETPMSIYKSIKMGMFREKISLEEKFQILKDLGYDGIELNSPGGVDKKEALAASDKVGLPIHGVVDSIHWRVRLSDPDPQVRQKGLEGLLTAIQDAYAVRGSAALLVPGKVTNDKTENHDQVWERSIEQIRKAIPLASKLGIRILIENVWNGFCYDPKQLADYIDEINSPWVGVYFDIGNHRKYGKPEDWIRTLGSRIAKLDVKDWGQANGFCKIGEGDVDWAEVRKALKDIGYSGWATAEVRGGNRDRIKEVKENMDAALGA